MWKTIWIITDETENVSTELTYYHFKAEPKFPSWYMEANHSYNIEMIWNIKLIRTFNIFFKCLTHFYIIK